LDVSLTLSLADCDSLTFAVLVAAMPLLGAVRTGELMQFKCPYPVFGLSCVPHYHLSQGTKTNQKQCGNLQTSWVKEIADFDLKM
jgi:hypothetical protein